MANEYLQDPKKVALKYPPKPLTDEQGQTGEQPAINAQQLNDEQNKVNVAPGRIDTNGLGGNKAVGRVSASMPTNSATVLPNTGTAPVQVNGQPPRQAAAGGFQGKTLDDLGAWLRERLNANKPESEEDRKKRERRQKWEGIISGISDMGAALSNLYFTTKGAPNMYDATTGMGAKTRARWDKDKAEREKRNDEYINYALKLYEIEKQQENEKRRKILEQREDEAYGHGLERRSKTEQLEDAKLRNLENQNDRNAIYAAKNEIYDRYKSGEISEEEALRQIDQLTKAYNGKWGATYTKSANDKTGTTEKVTSARKEDMSTISDKAPMTPAGRSGRSGGKGGKQKDDRETVTEEEYTVDALGRRTGKKVRKYKVPNGASGSQGKGANTPPSRRNNKNSNTPPSRRK